MDSALKKYENRGRGAHHKNGNELGGVLEQYASVHLVLTRLVALVLGNEDERGEQVIEVDLEPRQRRLHAAQDDDRQTDELQSCRRSALSF